MSEDPAPERIAVIWSPETRADLTSFPEFSPDGKKLVFVSGYQSRQRYEFNVFTADWKP